MIVFFSAAFACYKGNILMSNYGLTSTEKKDIAHAQVTKVLHGYFCVPQLVVKMHQELCV